jgi:hypothetical protein
VPRLCATKSSPTLICISFLGNEDKIPKQPRKIICLISDLFAQQIFWGLYLLAPWHELGLSHVQIKAIVEAHNFGIQTFTIRGPFRSPNLHRKIILSWAARISLGLSWSRW